MKTKEKEIKIPEWLKENYIPVKLTVEAAYWRNKANFSIAQPTDYDNAEENNAIQELALVQAKIEEDNNNCWKKGKGMPFEEYMDLQAKKSNLMKWLYDFWQQVGIPSLLYTQNGKMGLKDYKGDILLNAEYDDIQLNYNEEELLAPQCIVVCKQGKWGLIDKRGNELLTCQYQKIYPLYYGYWAVEQDGKWGVYSILISSQNIWKLECAHEAVYSNDTSPIGLIVYSDKGKFGWTGCQCSENNSKAEYDAVYLPNEAYWYSDQYGEDTEDFLAIKEGKIYDIEYWTSK